MSERMIERINGCMNEWANEWMSEWMNEDNDNDDDNDDNDNDDGDWFVLAHAWRPPRGCERAQRDSALELIAIHLTEIQN